MTQRKKMSKFWIAYITATTVLIMAVAGLLVFFWQVMGEYEESRPTSVVSQTLSVLNECDEEKICDMMASNGTLSEFDRAADIEGILTAKISGKKLDYAEKRGEHSDEAPVYSIRADKDEIAILRLTKTENTDNRFGKWEATLEMATESIEILAPDTATVSINGIELSDEHVAERDIAVEELSRLPESVTQPKMKKYSVNGIHFLDGVTAVTEKGVTAEVLPGESNEEGALCYTVSFTGDDSLKAEHEELIKKIATVYSNYVSIDATFAELNAYLVKGSELSRRLSTLPVNFYAIHDGWEIRNFETKNYLYYSEDCYSVNVVYDYVILRKGKEDTIKTDMTLVMVKLSGGWYVCDIGF